MVRLLYDCGPTLSQGGDEQSRLGVRYKEEGRSLRTNY